MANMKQKTDGQKPIIAVLQARTSSTRLPGKVLLPILDQPMLAWELDRIRRVKNVDRIIVATSSDPSDGALADLCRDMNVTCFRGSLNDVLDRFYQAVSPYRPEHVVRLTGDNPLMDPVIIDQVIKFHLAGGYDYTSNALKPTFPDGLDVEIFRFSVLKQTWLEASLPSQREHVTPFIYQHPERFSIGLYEYHQDLSALRWTVDEPEDLEFVCRVYEALYHDRPDFGLAEILNLLTRQPNLLGINQGHLRNEGYLKSLKEDEEWRRHHDHQT